MNKIIDEVGNKYDRLTVIELDRIQRTAYWVCKCICGKKIVVRGTTLRYVGNKSQSCGCKHKEIITTHGKTRTKVYKAWDSMKSRCSNETDCNYDGYGGRGIKVCKRWQKFESFYEDMGEPTTKTHSLDRIDNDGDYEPSNCRWATATQQQNNTRNNRLISYKGETKTAAQWARVAGVKYITFFGRINRGVPMELALQKDLWVAKRAVSDAEVPVRALFYRLKV